MDKHNANSGFSGFTYAEVMKLVELGLIQPSLTTELSLNGMTAGKTYNSRMKRGLYLIRFLEDQALVIVPLLRFTAIGAEISSLIEFEEGDREIFSSYESDLNTFWKTKKLELTSSPIA